MIAKFKARTILLSIVFMVLMSCRQSTSITSNASNNYINVIDSCDDADADISCSFENMPEIISNVMIISDKDAVGDKLQISGTVFRKDGKTPYRDLIIYAYHTDSKGFYSKSGRETGAQKWHGQLHGWCKTDKDGQYRIETIRPARYPDNSMPAHIHAAVRNEHGKMYWISDFVFKDDRLVNDKYLSALTTVGGNGVVTVQKGSDGKWIGKRDIVLSD